MYKKNEIAESLKCLLREYFEIPNPETILNETKVSLNVPSYGWEEVWEALDSLLSARVTMGAKVKEFESRFAEYLGVKHAVMVNSGSSANLVALTVLSSASLKRPICPGDEIITPAVTWATTLYPIANCGAVPVLVDVDMNTFNLNIGEIEKAITSKTRAIMPVHLLGNPCEIEPLVALARKHDLYIIEDACEAHGALVNGKKVGSFGDIGTFSFYFSHHISTIEGGMVVTDSDEYADIARSIRVFGWVRDIKEKNCMAKEYSQIDPRYLFSRPGYNLRPTEIQGAFGIHQIGKLDDFIEIRRDNADYWTKSLARYSDYLKLPSERLGTRHVWFGYPITVKPNVSFSKDDLSKFLERGGVETRPIMSGNMDEQPAMKLIDYRRHGQLNNSRMIMRNSFFFGNHHGVGPDERELVVDLFGQFMAEIRS